MSKIKLNDEIYIDTDQIEYFTIKYVFPPPDKYIEIGLKSGKQFDIYAPLDRELEILKSYFEDKELNCAYSVVG